MADTTATTSNDNLNGGSGEDELFGLEGDDRVKGGSGDDTLDGGAGSDTVSGGSGDDILIYRVSEGSGGTDIYDGGSGTDTIRLMLTADSWTSPDVQQDVANYLLFLAGHTLPNGQADNTEFRFTAFDLRVSKLEMLEIYVDGIAIDPADQAVAPVDDSIATSEDAASATFNLLANDSVPDLVKDVVVVQGPSKGTISLTKDLSDVTSPVAAVVYTPGAELQSLGVGESTTDTFTYKVIDADGDESIATVTVTVFGSNDGPVITAEAGDSAGTAEPLVETDAGLSTCGTLTVTDVDVTDTVSVSVIGVAATGPTGALMTADLLSYFAVSPETVLDSVSTSGKFTWTFDSGNQAFDFLAAGETLTLQYTIRPDDGHGGPSIGDGVVTIHISGTADAVSTITGVALDGYIAGATVFADVDGDGVLDPDEASTTTDANGNFILTGASGSLVLIGGTDISTGQAFTGVLRAPEGSTVVTPLTTLVVELAGAGATQQELQEANAAVLQVLGLAPNLELGSFDPIAATLSTDADDQLVGQAAIAAAVQLQNTIAQTAALLAGAGAPSLEEATNAVIAVLAGQVAAQAGPGLTLDLTDPSTLLSVLTGAASLVLPDPDAIGQIAAGAANVIAASNELATDALSSGETGTDLLSTLARISYVAQGAAALALQEAGEQGTPEAIAEAEASFTEASLEAAVAGAPVGDVVGANGPDTIIGTANADTLNGYGGNDNLIGLNGDDLLIGGAGDDVLDGGTGNDTLIGGTGFNIFRGGAGDDHFVQSPLELISDGGRAEYGGATGPITVNYGAVATVTGDASVGTDTLERVDWVVGTAFGDTFTTSSDFLAADGSNFNEFEGGGGDDVITGNGNTRISYLTAAAGVTVDLAAGIAQSTEADDAAGVGVDTFTGVIQVRGSSFDDILLGSDEAGFESFRGQAGDDLINGRGGQDRADYRNSPNGIVVALGDGGIGTGTVEDGWGGTDTLIGIEQIRGSEFDDVITMDDGDNRAIGRAGDDFIMGAGGNDVLIGDEGNDTLVGGAGDDVLEGGTGIDTAIYSGLIAEYTVRDNFDGTFTISHLAGAGADGTDTVRGVQFLQFANGQMELLVGTPSDDMLDGGTDFKVFRGDAGDDLLIQAPLAGFNDGSLAEYGNATGPISVTMAAVSTVEGDNSVGTDTLERVDWVRGSSFNDTYIALESYSGGDGSRFNEFEGGDGDDEITGNGSTRVGYYSANGAVIVDLGEGYASGWEGGDSPAASNIGIDTIITGNLSGERNGVTDIRGSMYDDYLIGSDGFWFENFRGLYGNDLIDGGGGGQDRADYRSSNGIIVVMGGNGIGTGTVEDGFGTVDTLIGIEQISGSNFADHVTMDDGNNHVRGRDGDDVVFGMGGNDTLIGDEGDDTLYGGAGDDVLEGGAGNDTLIGGTGFNIFRGGAGDDHFVQSPLQAVTDGGRAEYRDATAGITVVLGAVATVVGDDSVGTDTLERVEYVLGTTFNDDFTATNEFVSGDGTTFAEFEGSGGDDVINGNGNTRISFATANGAVIVELAEGTATGWADGGSPEATNVGSDSFTGVNQIRGSSYDDALYGSHGAGFESFRGQAGNDLIDGGGGSQDRADYRNSPNGIIAMMGDGGIGTGWVEDGFGSTDSLFGIEQIRGSEFADEVTMDDGNNRVQGQAGDDYIVGAGGNDVLIGGDGTDTAVYFGDLSEYEITDNGNGSFTVAHIGGTGSDGTDTLTEIELLQFNDTIVAIGPITGTSNNDFIVGTDGDDVIYGLEGDDTIIGLAGDDEIDGGDNSPFVDMVDYSESPGGVNVNLSTGVATDGWGFVDQLSNIEGVTDSQFDDVIIGDGNTNWVRLSGGTDFADGGGGVDVVFYESSGAGVTIDLDAEFAIDGEGNTDTLLNFENAHGSYFDDVITLTEGNGYVFARAGNDTIHALGGNDVVMPGSGNDFINGGAGSDTVSYLDDLFDGNDPASQGVHVDLSAGLATDGWGDTDTLVSIENVVGSSFDDTITGDDGDNSLDGGDGNDTLNGGTGFNIFRGGAGDDHFVQSPTVGFNDGGRAEYGNATGPIAVSLGAVATVTGDASVGTDTLERVDWVVGTAFADTFIANGDFVAGDGSNFNEFEGGGGNDDITGNGNTRISYRTATSGVTVDLENGIAQSTEPGDAAGIGVDIFTGVNQIRGSSFDDVLLGSDGDGFESFRAQAGNDMIDGGGGNEDRADYRNSPDGIVAVMGGDGIGTGTVEDGFGGTDTLIGIEQIRGSNFADAITMDDGNNRVQGLGGNDVVFGLGGNDTLFGDEGDDTLDGGAGDDVLKGGTGSDSFVFADGYGLDTIADFSGQDGDIIDLTGVAGVASFSELVALMTESDAAVAINFGNGDVLTLQNQTIENLNSNDFLLSA